MAYTVGISSGYFKIASQKGSGAEFVAGIHQKIYNSSRFGTKFTQVDIETITEFGQPGLKDAMKKVIKEGFEFGIHGECEAIGRTTLFLDSPYRDQYKLSHERLYLHLKHSGELGAKYMLVHSSESEPFVTLWHDLKPVDLVDFNGRPLRKLFEENPKLLDWFWKFINREDMPAQLRRYIVGENRYFEKKIESYYYSHEGKQPPKEEADKMRKDSKEEADGQLFDFFNSQESEYGPERLAYYIIAKYMMNSYDVLWKNIVGKDLSDADLIAKPELWVSAVAGKYIWGHFNTSLPEYKEQNLKKELEKSKMYFVMETPMASPGHELNMRFSNPLHIYYLAECIGSDWVGVAIDFEHMLGSKIDPKETINKFPMKGGNRVKVVHLGAPVPYAPAHLGIPRASDAQVYIYERLWELREKGFKDAWLIFERSGEEGIQDSVLSIKLIAMFLEKNVPPKDLPLEFFGLKEFGPEIKRQELTIRQHMLDPLKGLLTVHEEDFGFFGTSAHKKGKAKEWVEEEYR
ncbi:MAG: hypothetical protein KJ697_03065 [Nanoarchaeota archaeon]|nr:hypothetical protein [Nanoarchaeota archaeon]